MLGDNIMRTTINIQNEVINDLMRFSSGKTKTAAVNYALNDWVRIKKIQTLRSLRGKIDMADDLETQRKFDMDRI